MTEQEEKRKTEEQMEALETALSGRTRDEGFWREMWQQIRLVWHLLRDPEVPWYLKLLPVVAVGYALFPADLIPDLFPFLGQLDDLTALLVGGKVFIELSPPHVVARHIRAMRHSVNASQEETGDGEPSVDDIADAIIIEGEFTPVDGNEEDRAE